MVGAIISIWLASLFAEPASLEARKAVKITHCWTTDQIAQLEFQHEQLAEMVQKTCF
jgi:hypothetical protein